MDDLLYAPKSLRESVDSQDQDNSDPNLFATEVRNCAGSTVALTTYSAKGQRSLIIDIPVPTPSPTLGLTLQWSPLSTVDQVWHILEVAPNSPADTAGLLPFSDFIVGSPEGNVHGEAGIGELFEDYVSRQLRLFVYNQEYGITRLVTITPSRSWGGSGTVGCVLGFGALHRLPAPLTEGPVAGPGEALFEGVRLSGDRSRSTSMPKEAAGYSPSMPEHSGELLVPATLASPPTLQPTSNPPAGGPSRGGRRAKKTTSPGKAFEEYFAEGEQKSKEEDFTPSSKGTGPPPPPPGSKGVSENQRPKDTSAVEKETSKAEDAS